jgi:SprT-like family
MDLDAAEKLAFKLFAEYLPGWDVLFRFTSDTVALGRCARAKDGSNHCRILPSKYFVFLNNEATVRKTLLHEIAHARANAKGQHGHDAVWKAEARKLGLKDPRAYCTESVPIPTQRKKAAVLRSILNEIDREIGDDD